MQTMIEAANAHLAGAIDFVVLPGDNADDGTEPQFRLVRDAVDRLRLPLHVLPGDHDFKQRSLEAFYRVLATDALPKSLRKAGARCLFLDVVSAGSGGADFRLDEGRLAWLERDLDQAATAGERTVIFMHTYPADLKAGAEALRALIDKHRVAAVDMGHTHYNELANDGRTIFSATRSTGQTEEGPVGFSLAALDGSVVSWRFKPLAGAWPFVLITSPADERLITDPAASDQVARDAVHVRAKVWSGQGIARVECRIDQGEWRAMSPLPGAAALWQARCAAPGHRFALSVRAHDRHDGTDEETIRVASSGYDPPTRRADGSDADAIDAWPEKGILGTQLGPNKNGKQW
ncbi:MAG: metallophosphoesterase [Pseudomonadota bacterium]|nr:metallophosphoesterase [Pseudomonadota bacterium]